MDERRELADCYRRIKKLEKEAGAWQHIARNLAQELELARGTGITGLNHLMQVHRDRGEIK